MGILFFWQIPLDIVSQCVLYWNTVLKLSESGSRALRVRLPVEWYKALCGLADDENTVSMLVRDAVKQFLRRNGKLKDGDD